MTKREFSRALCLAQSPDARLAGVDTSALDGCGLPGFGRVTVTLRQFAALLRWQCQYVNGDFDSREVTDMAYIARTRVDLAGDGSQWTVGIRA